MLIRLVVTSLRAGSEKDLDVMLVEPVMTAIMQDRLGEAVPLQLALALVDRCEIRVSHPPDARSLSCRAH
jgi:nucleolar pre-ribosomal-associated protein 1